MPRNNESRKWLYDNLRSNGFNVGSTYDEFSKLLDTNKDARQWCYDTARGAGLNVGKDFNEFSTVIGSDSEPSKKKQGSWTPTAEDIGSFAQTIKNVDNTLAKANAPLRYAEERRKNPLNIQRVEIGAGSEAPQLTNRPRVLKTGVQIDAGTGKLQPTYATEAGNEYTDRIIADMEQSRIDKARKDILSPIEEQLKEAYAVRDSLDERMGQLGKKEDAEHDNVLAMGASASNATGGLYYGDELRRKRDTNGEYRQLHAAAEQNRQRIVALEAERDKADAGFWRGAADAISDPTLWDFGYTDMITAGALWNASKGNNGKTAQEIAADKTLMGETAKNQQAQEDYASNRGALYRFGQIGATSIPFMLEFMLMGGADAFGGFGAKMGAKAAAKMGLQGMKQKAMKYTGTALTELAASNAMANAMQSGSTAEDIVHRHLGDVEQDEQGNYKFTGGDDWGTAIYKGEMAATLENYTEMLGNHLSGKMLGELGGKVLNGLDKMRLGRVSEAFRKAGSSQYAELGGKFLKKAGINGYFNEVAEEEANIVLNSALVGDNKLSDLVDGRTQLDIWGGLLFSVGAMEAIPKGIGTFGAMRYYAKKRDVAKADKLADFRMTHEKWEPLREQIDNTGNEDMAKLAEQIVHDENLYPQEKQVALDYMGKLIKFRGFNTAQAATAREQSEGEATNEDILSHSMDGAYIQGHEASDAQKPDIKARYDDAVARVRELFHLGDNEGIDDALWGTPVEDINGMRAQGYSDEDLQTVLDYYNSKAAYDGMISGVRDTIDDAITTSDNEVESRRNDADGMIHPATMKVDDRRVYIIGGNVTMNDDGTMVDRENSDESVIIRDATTGEMEFTDPSRILSVDEALDAEEEKAAAAESIRQQFAQRASDTIDGVLPLNPNDEFDIVGDDDAAHAVQVVGQYVDEKSGQPVPNAYVVNIDGQQTVMPREQLQLGADAARKARLQASLEQRNAAQAEEQKRRQEQARPTYALNDEVTLRTPDGNLVRGSVTADMNEDGQIEVFTESPINGNRANLFTQDELDGMVVEQNGEARDTSIYNKVEENADNGTTTEQPQTPATTTEQQQQQQQPTTNEQQQQPATALSRIPVGEDGNPQYEKAPVKDTWEALVEQSEGDEQEVIDIATEMANDARADLAKEQKKTPKGGKTYAEKQAVRKAHKEAIAALQKKADYWDSVAGFKEAEQKRAAEQAKLEKKLKMAELREKQAKIGRYSKENSELGDYIDFRDYVMRTLACGLRLRWNDDQNDPKKKGLASHLGLKGSNAERGKRIWLISNDGMTPEQAAQSLVQGYAEATGYEGYAEDLISTTDALNELLDVVSNYNSPRDMFNDAKERHGNTTADEQAWEEQKRLEAEEDEAKAMHMTVDEWRDHKQSVAESMREILDNVSDQELAQFFVESEEALEEEINDGYTVVEDETDETDESDNETENNEIEEYETDEYETDETDNGADEGGTEVLSSAQPHIEGENGGSQTTGQGRNDGLAGDGNGDVQAAAGDYTLSDIVSDNGEHFYQDADGNIDLAIIPDDVFRQIGKPSAPFRLIPSMLKHVFSRHGKEMALTDPQDAIDFVLDVLDNFDHVRQGDGDALVFSIENGRNHTGRRAVTILLSSKNGDYYGISTSGYERIDGLKKRKLLWEKGANNASPTDVASANVPTANAQQGNEQSGSASNMSNFNDGKGTQMSDKDQGKTVKTESEGEKSGNNGEKSFKLGNVTVPEKIVSQSKGNGNWTDVTLQTKGLTAAVFDDGHVEFIIDCKDEFADTPQRIIDELKKRGYETYSYDGKTVMTFDSYDEAKKAADIVNQLNTEEEFNKWKEAKKQAEAIAQAEQQVNTEPTEKQKEAGNYKKGHVRVDGYDISIEQPKGSVRRGTDKDGNAWESEMHNTYGYIRGTEGTDGDHIDIFLSDNPEQGNVYVIDQVNPETGEFDEHKVMYGFNSIEEAKDAYLSNYEKGWKGLGTITETTKDEFKKWVNSSHRKTKPFAEYKSVKPTAAAAVNPAGKAKTVDNEQSNEGDNYQEKTLWRKTRNDGGSAYAYIAARNGNMLDVRFFHDYGKGEAKKMSTDEFRDTFGGEHVEVDSAMLPATEVPKIESAIKRHGGRSGLRKQLTAAAGNPAEKVAESVSSSAESAKAEENDPRKKKNKLGVSEEEKDEALKKLRDLLMGKGENIAAGLDLTVLMTQGGTLARYYVGNGIEKFADFAKTMYEDMRKISEEAAEQLKPYIQRIYMSLQGDMEISEDIIGRMDDVKTVRNFNLASLGKQTSADPFETAELVVKQMEVEKNAKANDANLEKKDVYEAGDRVKLSDGRRGIVISIEQGEINSKPTVERYQISTRGGFEYVAPDKILGLVPKPTIKGNEGKSVDAEVEKLKQVFYFAGWPNEEQRKALKDAGYQYDDETWKALSDLADSYTFGDINEEEYNKKLADIVTDNGKGSKQPKMTKIEPKHFPKSEKPAEDVKKTPSTEEKPKKENNKKKKVVSSQPQLDLFGNNEQQNDNENGEKEVHLQSGTGTAEREGGHQHRQDEPLGEGEQHEAERTDGRRVDRRDSEHPVSDNERGKGLSDTSEGSERLAEPKNTHNNHAERGKDYAPRSTNARIEANIKAIETMQRLVESGEKATPEDMAVLRQFSGWGGLGTAFKEKIPGRYEWQEVENPINKRLRELLTPEQYDTAVMSINSAYYTPANVIDTMWDIAKALGFEGGNVLEGSAGIGNIIGLMPREMSERSDIAAIEIDGVTGQILKLLYPDATVGIQGFETAKIRNGSVDLAITNVPFGAEINVFDKSGDKDLSKKFRAIHDFCIAKNVRKLREGGIGIFITTSGTLDNSYKLRKWITNEGNADVVGAFRMNNKTFGGTGATSDIIIIRKRVNGKKSANAIDVSNTKVIRKAEYDDGKGNKNSKKTYALDINQYFADHPENMAGEMSFAFEKGDTYRATSKALYPSADKDQARMLADWAASFAGKDWEKAEENASDTQVYYDKLGEDVKEGSMLIDSNGNLCLAQMGKAVPLATNDKKVKGHTKAECFTSYKAVKDALAEVLKYQTENEDDKGLKPLLDKLNKAYDDFVNTYGHVNRNVVLSFLRSDIDYPNIAALEDVSERGDKSGKRIVEYRKTDVFKHRVVEKETRPKPTNVKDGIIASIYLNGRVDVPYIAEQLGTSEEAVRKEMVEKGLGFENPLTTDMEVSYEYLSGNVREKLQQAKDYNADGKYSANIKVLEKVIPMDIPAHLIDFSLGSSWLEPKLFEDFVRERTGVGCSLHNVGGTWMMQVNDAVNTERNKTMGVFSEKCGKTVLGHELIEAAMQNKTISVSKTTKYSDGTTETITDKDATMACANKIDELRQDFKDWARSKMQEDTELADRIERTYNDKFNNYVPKSIPDEFVPKHFGGAATVLNGREFHLRTHQAKAVILSTTQPTMLAHEVGTGKTFTLITSAMEMRRLGTAHKPMIVVQNATVGQFVASAKAIYPNAKILTLEDADRTKEGRKNFYAKIRYNDWDMIVVPQSVFERIPDSPEREARFIEDKIEEKMMVLEQMRRMDDSDRNPLLRRAEKELESLQDELANIKAGLKQSPDGTFKKKTEKDKKREAVIKQNAAVKAQEMLDRETDDTLNFDDMGIDALLVDEAHEYKHLGFATAMQRGVKGVDSSYSKKSQGVYLKTQAVLENNNGRNVVFATGTPISNTAAEIWTFMRYLMPAEKMKDYGIYYFDDFVRNFGLLQQVPEFGASGKYKEVNRFLGYVNLPELVRIWNSVADVVRTQDAGGVSDKIPEMEGGKAQDVFLPQTKALRGVMKYVKEQLDAFEQMSGKEKKQNSYIPLTMYGIAKAAAVDARLVVDDAPDEPFSKTNETVRQTLKSLKETERYKGTVAIFADNYQNKHSGFNLYEDIRKKLIDAGVPDSEIVVMKSGMTVKKKLEIFDKVNSGEVRVIMGSTFTLGTGVNIQERLHTLIHVDAPVRPMDYTQRNGRILRQGNMHKEWGLPVRVLRFGVEDSLDVTAYQRLKTKGAIADSIMNGKHLIENSMENRALEEEQDVFGDITAQLSGSQYALLKNQVEKEVKKLKSRKSQWEQQQTYVHNQLPRLKGDIKRNEGIKEQSEAAIKKVEAMKDQKITVNGNTYGGIKDMDDFIKEYNKAQRESQEKVRKGNYNAKESRSLTVNVGGIDFHVSSTITQVQKQNSEQLSLFTSASTDMRVSCPDLGLENMPVEGQQIRTALNDIVQDYASGNYFRERMDTADDVIERKQQEVATLEKQVGKPFEDEEKLEKANEKLAEYEELMKKELAEKEAKYAQMDSEVEAASNVNTVEDEEDNADERFRTSEQLFEEYPTWLSGQTTSTGQHTTQITSTVASYRKMGEHLLSEGKQPSEVSILDASSGLGVGTQELKKMGFDVEDVEPYPSEKRTAPTYTSYADVNKKYDVVISNAVLNVIPDDWRADVLKSMADKLKDGGRLFINVRDAAGVKAQKQKIELDDPSEILVTDKQGNIRAYQKGFTRQELADYVKQQLGDDFDVETANAKNSGMGGATAVVVTRKGNAPLVYREVKTFENGETVPIKADMEDGEEVLYVDGLNRTFTTPEALLDAFRTKYPNMFASLNKEGTGIVVTPWSNFLKGNKTTKAATERKTAHAQEAVYAKRLHLDNVEVITDTSELKGNRAKAKGIFDVKTGKITIVLPNHTDVQDVVRTILHEGVAHYGLRQLLGDHFNTFLDNVLANAESRIANVIRQRASSRFLDAIAQRKPLTYEEACRIETEEYLASLAEDTNFENVNQSWWHKIKNLFLKALAFATGIHLDDKLTDNDLRYYLWRSYDNLAHPSNRRSLFNEAEDIALQDRLGVGNYRKGEEQAVSSEEQSVEVEDEEPEDLEPVVPSRKSPTAPVRKEVPERKETVKFDGVPTKKLYDKLKRNHPNALLIFKNGDFYEGYNEDADALAKVLHIANVPYDGDFKNVAGFPSHAIDTYLPKIVRAGHRVAILDGENVAEDEDVRFRQSDTDPIERVKARDDYEREIGKSMYQFTEAFQDSMLGLKTLMDKVLKASGKKEAADFENAYMAENAMSSKNRAEADLYNSLLMKPLIKAVSKLEKGGASREATTDYMMAKHGLERNEFMAQRDYDDYMEKAQQQLDEYLLQNPKSNATIAMFAKKSLADFRKRDYAGLTALTGESDTADAEAAARTMVDDFESKHDTDELWQRTNACTKATLAKVYQGGLLDKDTYESIRDMYHNYIPLRGWDEKTSDEVYGYLTDKKGAMMGSIMKRAGGRSSLADDPIATIAAMAETGISQANRNLMKQKFLNFVLNNPSDAVSVNNLWLKYDDVSDEWKPVFANLDPHDTADEVERKVEAFESKMEQLHEQDPDKYKRGREAKHIPFVVKKQNLREHQVMVKRAGQTYVLTINGNPRAAQALNGLTNPNVEMEGTVGNILKAGEYVNRHMSAFYTTRNPGFVVSNFIRDAIYSNVMSWVKEGGNYSLKFFKNFMRYNPISLGYILNKYGKGTLDMNDPTERMFYQFMANGGETGYTINRDVEAQKKAIKDELKKQGQRIPIRKAVSWLGVRLDDVNRSVENCARFAAFLTSRQMGRSVERSVWDAKEISVNFNKKGAGSKFLGATGQKKVGNVASFISGGGRIGYVFWNAGVQGFNNFTKNVKEHPVKGASAMAALFLLGALIPLLGGDGDGDDDKNYYNLPDFVRRSNVCFRIGDKWITIPLAIEMRAWYGLGELASSVMSGNEKLSGGEIAKKIAEQVSQLFPLDFMEGGGGLSAAIPSSVKPVAEVWTNKDWTGLPIYKNTPYNTNDPEWTKAYSRTNRMLVELSKTSNELTGGDDFKKGWADWNPAVVEHMLEGVFGGVTTTVNQMAKTAETVAGERDFDWRNIPVASRVVKNADERTQMRSVNENYFKCLEEYKETQRLVNKYENAADEGMMEYAEKVNFLYNSEQYRRFEIMEDFISEIGDLQDEMKETDSEEERKVLEAEQNELKKQMLDTLRSSQNK